MRVKPYVKFFAFLTVLVAIVIGSTIGDRAERRESPLDIGYDNKTKSDGSLMFDERAGQILATRERRQLENVAEDASFIGFDDRALYYLSWDGRIMDDDAEIEPLRIICYDLEIMQETVLYETADWDAIFFCEVIDSDVYFAQFKYCEEKQCNEMLLRRVDAKGRHEVIMEVDYLDSMPDMWCAGEYITVACQRLDDESIMKLRDIGMQGEFAEDKGYTVISCLESISIMTGERKILDRRQAEIRYDDDESLVFDGEMIITSGGYEAGAYYEVINLNHERIDRDGAGTSEIYYRAFRSDENIYQFTAPMKLNFISGGSGYVVTGDHVFEDPDADTGRIYFKIEDGYECVTIPGIEPAYDIRNSVHSSGMMVFCNCWDVYILDYAKMSCEKFRYNESRLREDDMGYDARYSLIECYGDHISCLEWRDGKVTLNKWSIL